MEKRADGEAFGVLQQQGWRAAVRRGQGRQSQRRDPWLNCVGGCVAPAEAGPRCGARSRAQGCCGASSAYRLMEARLSWAALRQLIKESVLGTDGAAEAALGGFLRSPLSKLRGFLGVFHTHTRKASQPGGRQSRAGP